MADVVAVRPEVVVVTAVAVAAGMAVAPGAAASGPVTWNAKDGMLAFRNGAEQSLQLVKPGGSTYTTIADQATQPAWSPDGSRITFASDGGGDNVEVYVMDADGDNPTNLTNNTETDFYPAWSPRP